MRLRVKNGSMMEVEIKDVCFTLGVGEDLIETREKFLEYMGQMFDEAIYNSLTEELISESEIDKALTGGRGLRSKAMMIDEYSHIPNTVMMQIMKDGKESYDTLKEITDYMQKGNIEREMLDNLK